MNALVAERDRVVADFRSFAAALGSAEPAGVAPLREAAIERFAELGFPSRKREDWKYTNVAPIAKAVRAPARRRSRPAPHIAATSLDAGVLRHALVFVDGRFDDALSTAEGLPGGAVVCSLERALREHSDLALPRLRDSGADEQRCFAALNDAFRRDGAFVWLPDGAVLDRPLHLVFVATAAASEGTSHVRNLISVGRRASAVVAEHYVASGGADYVTNAVSDVVVREGGSLDHVAVVREGSEALHIGTTRVRVGRDACLRSHAFALEGRLTRNEITVLLAEEGAECELSGLYLAGGRQHVDNQTTVDHAVPHGTSRELYKGVLSGRARGIFNGVVIVRPGAQKSDARQTNANLLLSDGSEIDTRPNLEIYADDVKCAHGSTVGRLDDDALFFLRARGIGEAEARQMLARAFAMELVERLPTEELRSAVGAAVDQVIRVLEAAA